MPDIDQYSFAHKEVAEALVKMAGLNAGKWQLVMNFALGAANVGGESGTVAPTALVAVVKIGLTKAQPTSPQELVVDAAVVNPAST